MPSEILDPNEYIETFLVLRTKDKKTAPFLLNPVQRLASQEQALRNVYVKPRQVGLSSWILGQNFARTVTTPNFRAVSIAHDADTSEMLFDRVHFFYNNLPDGMKPVKQYSSRRELSFPGLNSSYLIYTAGGKGPGLGDTVNAIHGSEVSRWPKPDEIIAGLLESAPKDATVDLESTAYGAGTWFQSLYNEARDNLNGYKAHFFPWWLDPNYTLTDAELKAYRLDPNAPAEDDDEERLIMRHNLSRDQINWRRWKVSSLKKKFQQEYPEDDITCFLTSGNMFFDLEVLQRAQRIGVQEPIEILDNGRLKVWERPSEWGSYVMGVDVAEGVAAGDYSAAYVIDESTGQDVAALHGHWDTHAYAEKLAELGYRYNTAKIAVERNNHGHAVLSALMYELAYPEESIYHHKDYDAKGEVSEKPGFPTNVKTKPIMLSNLVQLLQDAPEAFLDHEFFSEGYQFVQHDNGKIGAQQGCHDDRIMAKGIGMEVRSNHRSVGGHERAGSFVMFGVSHSQKDGRDRNTHGGGQHYQRSSI